MRGIVRPVILALGLLLLLPLAGSDALAASARVSIRDFFFMPASVSISPNETVTWTNNGQVPHTVKLTSGGTAETGVIDPGKSVMLQFPLAGTYSYICGIHPQMMGTVVVSAPQPTPTSPPPPPPTTRPPTPPPATPTATATETPSPTPTPTPSPSPAPTRTEVPTPSPTGSLLGAPQTPPAAQANFILGVGLIVVGAAILGGAVWWRFRSP